MSDQTSNLAEATDALVKIDSADSLQDKEAVAVATLLTSAGFPIPPTMVRNVFLVVNTLIASAVDIPNAWLEGVAENIRTNTEVRKQSKLALIPTIKERIEGDSELAERALENYLPRLVKQQANREAVVRKTLSHLKSTTSHASDINLDWLERFGRLAEIQSDEVVQDCFARILAGEIGTPGSFSPASIETLARMTPDVADLFQRFCSITVQLTDDSSKILVSPFVLTEPVGNPNANALISFGLSYPELSELRDMGLIQHDFNARIHVPLMFFGLPVILGGQRMKFEVPAAKVTEFEKEKALGVLNFTRAGRELFRVVQPVPSSLYVEKFLDWIHQQGFETKG